MLRVGTRAGQKEGGMKGWKRMKNERSAGGEEVQGGNFHLKKGGGGQSAEVRN